MAVAQELGVPGIDLNSMGVEINAALGVDAPKQFGDQTHHVEYGAYLQSKCIALGIQQAKLPLAKYIVDDFGAFDPAHPSPLPAAFDLPSDGGAAAGGRADRVPPRGGGPGAAESLIFRNQHIYNSYIMRLQTYGRLTALCLLAGMPAFTQTTTASDARIAHLEQRGAATQLIVDGKPYLVLAGEADNTASSSLEYMDTAWPKVARPTSTPCRSGSAGTGWNRWRANMTSAWWTACSRARGKTTCM